MAGNLRFMDFSSLSPLPCAMSLQSAPTWTTTGTTCSTPTPCITKKFGENGPVAQRRASCPSQPAEAKKSAEGSQGETPVPHEPRRERTGYPRTRVGGSNATGPNPRGPREGSAGVGGSNATGQGWVNPPEPRETGGGRKATVQIPSSTAVLPSTPGGPTVDSDSRGRKAAGSGGGSNAAIPFNLVAAGVAEQGHLGGTTQPSDTSKVSKPPGVGNENYLQSPGAGMPPGERIGTLPMLPGVENVKFNDGKLMPPGVGNADSNFVQATPPGAGNANINYALSPPGVGTVKLEDATMTTTLLGKRQEQLGPREQDLTPRKRQTLMLQDLEPLPMNARELPMTPPMMAGLLERVPSPPPVGGAAAAGGVPPPPPPGGNNPLPLVE